MYSVKAIFQKEPNAIREVIITILGVFVMTGVVEISAEAVAGIGVGVSLLLGLFYVRPLSVSKQGLNDLSVRSETMTTTTTSSTEPTTPIGEEGHFEMGSVGFMVFVCVMLVLIALKVFAVI